MLRLTYSYSLLLLSFQILTCVCGQKKFSVCIKLFFEIVAVSQENDLEVRTGLLQGGLQWLCSFRP